MVQGIDAGSDSLLDDSGELHAYYHTDYLGTTDYLTSAVNSKVIAWTSYNEWGEITHNAVLKCGQRELDLVKEYATHDFDAVLSMYYAKARFYDPDNRRFTAQDPILDPSGYDLKNYVKDPTQLVQYLYVKDNAIIYIDSTGKLIEELQVWISGYGWKTVSELASEGVRWADWENILYSNVSARIAKLPNIKNESARNLVIDEIIYEEAESLQTEFRTIYYGSFSWTAIPTALKDLYTQYQRPNSETLWDIAFRGFTVGFKTGLAVAVGESAVQTNPENVVNTGKQPWTKDPWTRGNIIDKAFKNNLGHNFPTVDRLDDGILYSFKSYDTAAKSYQTATGFFNRLKCDINSLSQFTSRTWGGVTVTTADYSTKALQIGIPDRLLTAEQSKAIADAIVYAAERSIELIVKVVK